MKAVLASQRGLFLLSLVGVIALWEVVPRLFDVPHYVFPPLSMVIDRTFVKNFDLVLRNTSITLLEAFGGFVTGSIAGFFIGLGMAESRVFKGMALPYVVASNAVPVVALAPLAIILFGSGPGSKVAVAAFLCFFPLSLNTFKGLQEYHPWFSDLFKLYGATRWQFLTRFKLPNALPFIVTGLKLNAVYAIVGAIVAEFIGADRGLGFGMVQASYALDTAKLFGYVIVACLLGMSSYGLIQLAENYIRVRTRSKLD